MKNNPITSLAAILILSEAAFLQAQPEPPAIWREVTGVKYQTPTNTTVWHQTQNWGLTDSPLQPRHTRPHIPAFRTSADGRIAMRTLALVGFTLLKPEKVTTTHVNLVSPKPIGDPNSKNNSYVLSEEGYKYIRHENTPTVEPTGSAQRDNANLIYKNLETDVSMGAYGHWTLYDPSPTDLQGVSGIPGVPSNPTLVNGKDVYTLKVIGTLTDVTKGLKFCAITIKVTVVNPKTGNAAIESVIRQGPPDYGPWIPVNDPNAFELNIAADGRLLVLRIGPGKSFAWTDPTTGMAGNSTNGHNIIYSYYEGGNSADPTRWTSIHPISHAPYDARMNGTVAGKALGFALSKFRDPAGNILADGIGFGATYPWIDRDAKNLFFTAIDDTFKYGAAIGQARYPYTATSGQLPEEEGYSGSGNTQGVSFMGLWSHGKMVMVDNLLNEIDPVMGPDLFLRDVNLYNTSGYTTPPSVPGPAWASRQKLTLGGNRVNANGHMPLGDSRNSTIIDSMVNTFNYRKTLAPLTLRDVVWPMLNPKHNADLAFDDYTDYDSFIIAHMNGQVTLDAAGAFAHQSGWNNATKLFSVSTTRLQNAACAPRNRWIVPQNGQLTGTGVRLEPVAAGGIQGKGLWLSGTGGVKFTVVAQPTPSKIAGNTWYVGLFVDCRFPDTSNTDRDLITFPDGTRIVLRGANTLVYQNSSGVTVGSVDLRSAVNQQSLLPDPGWAHLAWQIRNGGKNIDFLLDGIVHTEVNNLITPIFQFIPGDVTIGKVTTSPNSGFKGWIDEFKVIAHEVDPETACNHAGGTLVGLTQGYSGYLLAIANSYPGSNALAIGRLNWLLDNTGETRYTNYVNLRDYTRDNGGNLYESLPGGVFPLRKAIHFPEGPIFHNRPRPDSTRNQFCMTCHIPGGAPGLTNSALTPTSLHAIADSRRQPSQPPPRVFGKIPVGFIDNSSVAGTFPSAEPPATSTVQNIDQWMQPSFSQVEIRSYTLVDVGSNADVRTIRTNGSTSVKRETGKTYAVRVNLDSAQGDVLIRHTSPTGTVTTVTKSFPYILTLPGTVGIGLHRIEADPVVTGATGIITFNFVN